MTNILMYNRKESGFIEDMEKYIKSLEKQCKESSAEAYDSALEALYTVFQDFLYTFPYLQ